MKALAIEEAEEDVEVLKASRLMYFESLQPHVNHRQHLEISRIIQQAEQAVSKEINERHQKKIAYYSKSKPEPICPINIEEAVKDKVALKKKEKRRRYRERKKIAKKKGLDEKRQRIKESGKVVNMSSIDISDSIYTFYSTKAIPLTLQDPTASFTLIIIITIKSNRTKYSI